MNIQNTPGIYSIKNISNGRIYIGSSIKMWKRKQSHFCSLENGTHINSFLLNDYKKCGKENFVFEVLHFLPENSTKQEILVAEQEYVNKYYDNQKQCYNLTNIVKDTRLFVKNKENSKENDKRKIKYSVERKIKQKNGIEKSQKENIKLWEEHKKRVDLARSLRWDKEISERKKITVVNLDSKEEIEILTSYKQFCKDKNLSYESFHQMVVGKVKTCGGWYIKGTDPTYHSQKGEIRKPLSEEHKQKISSGNKLHDHTGKVVVSPEGKSYIIPSNLTSFCEEHDLPRTTLGYMLKGERDNCKGWHLPEQDPNLIQTGKHFNKIVLSPDGQEHTGIKSIKDFCDLYGLSRPGFTDLLNEKSLSYRGWRLRL